MLKDISLGRYYDTGSVFHSLDPRVKVILYMVYLVAIFMINTSIGICILGIITVAQIIIAKFPPKVIWSTLKPILPLALFIFLLNLFTLKNGNTLWEWKVIKITDYGLQRAALMAIKLVFLIISTSIILTLTTTPLKIADALENLGSPLKAIKVPVHEMAMMMSIALRFIPTLIEETDKIMRAQVSRGANYDTGSFIDRIKGYITVLIPLFISSFKRAEDLAVAMDARCYRGGVGRTKLNPLVLTAKDVLFGLLWILLAAGVVVADFFLR